MSKITCIFGEACEEAVALVYLSHGCVCHSEQWQWLCAQHLQSCEPLSDAVRVPDAALMPIVELRKECAELEQTFTLRWDADQRAIKRWQAAGPPGRELIWPDHADLCVWLLERIDETVEQWQAATKCANTLAAKLMRIKYDELVDQQYGQFADLTGRERELRHVVEYYALDRDHGSRARDILAGLYGVRT